MLKHLWKIHLPRFHYVVNYWPLQPLGHSSKGQSQPGCFFYTAFSRNWPLFLNQLFKTTWTKYNFFCHIVELAKLEGLILLWLPKSSPFCGGIKKCCPASALLFQRFVIDFYFASFCFCVRSRAVEKGVWVFGQIPRKAGTQSLWVSITKPFLSNSMHAHSSKLNSKHDVDLSQPAVDSHQPMHKDLTSLPMHQPPSSTKAWEEDNNKVEAVASKIFLKLRK